VASVLSALDSSSRFYKSDEIRRPEAHRARCAQFDIRQRAVAHHALDSADADSQKVGSLAFVPEVFT
jgi:hypothetical protein